MPKRAIAEWTCQALTPLWTGNVHGYCADQLLESAVLGSMRWWLEAWARGAGWNVPDPIESRVIYSSKAPHDLDIVSRVFGATDWRRRFRLVTSGGTLSDIPAQIEAYTGNERKRDGLSSWYYKTAPDGKARALTGNFTIRIEQCCPWNADYDATSLELLHDLLTFMADYGCLGAKPQMGLGVFRILSNNVAAVGPTNKALITWLSSRRRPKPSPSSDPNLPDLRRFRFATLADTGASHQNQRQQWAETFRRKAVLRNQFRDPSNNRIGLDVRHTLMGTTVGQPTRAKLILSHPYRTSAAEATWHRRAWGWVPDEAEHNLNKLLEGRPPKLGCDPLPGVADQSFGCAFLRHPEWENLDSLAK